MKILITGGTGFIGSRLALRCLKSNDQVVVVGQQNTDAERQNKRLIEDNGGNVVIGSVTDRTLLNDISKGIDTVFHLAAAQHEANISDKIFYDVNVTGTRNMLEACIDSGVKRFVYGSTIGVYGNQDGLIDELTPCNPDNIYGKSKLEAEKLVLSHKNQISLLSIRISETYGPGDRRLLKLFRAIHKGKFFKIGPGRNLHHLIYIDDLVEGLRRAAESDKALGEVVLLVGPEQVTTDEMIDTISNCLDSKLKKIRVPLFAFDALAILMETTMKPLGIQPPLHRRRMDFFKKNFSFATAKAQELLGFTPRFNFAMGAAETANWYKQEGLLSDNGTADHQALPVDMVVDQDLAAQIEPFDTFWEAPSDIEKGFTKFAKFYKRNYLKYIPSDRKTRTLVISCGAGYMVDLLKKEGYTDVLGIDSDPEKIEIAQRHELNCKTANAFSYLKENTERYNLIFVEQEINHLTKKEILVFLNLCKENLHDGGILIAHSLNGANPITGSEALSQNFNHFNTFTEYSFRQILCYSNFKNIHVFPLQLYIFYENPVNYIGIICDFLLNKVFQAGFLFYGKKNKIFSKKIAIQCFK